ncbi:MAG: hypothetical protein CMO01_18215 [Thalassobius sp.]|nr:hypothetical protein [Thalassovita sp.]
MKYNNYDIEDFLIDPDFIDWVKGDSGEKNAFFQNWMLTEPENKAAALTAREILLNLKRDKLDPTPEEFDESLNKILRYRSGDEKKTEVNFRTIDYNEPPLKLSTVFKWAGSIALLLGLFWLYKFETKEKVIVEEVTYTTKSTPLGQKSNIKLPDGSKVKLNSGSSITFPSNFIKNREVQLKGEAFFEVEKNEDVPFRVIAEEIEVKVVGTSFNVQSIDTEETVEVTVVTGKVMTYNNEHNSNEFEALLSPNEMISYEKKTGGYSKKKAEAFKLAWKDDVLYFKDADFLQIVDQLERWYGVEFIFPNKDHMRMPGKINATFVNEPLKEVLEGLKFSMKIEYTIDKKNDKVIVKKVN